MNFNPLYELKERLESSVIAGTSLISEDFRLARGIEQMEPLSKVSPVFDKIYKSARGLLSEDCTEKGGRLLDVLALVDAVLATQAAVGVEGEVEPLEGFGEASYSNAPYSLLAPLLEALTTTGNGHYSLVVDTHDTNPEIFSDYRVKEAMIAGLGSGYTELAERLEEWLIKEDASLLPVLKRGFDPKGKKEMVRRVHVVEGIAGAGENGWYLSLLEQAEKEVREAAIYALRHSPENCQLLIGLTKTEKGNCKKAAMWALSKMENKESREFWEKQIKKKPAATARYLTLSTDDAISDLVANAMSSILDELKARADSADVLLSNEEYGRLGALFDAMMGKASSKMLDIYRRMAAESFLDSLKDEKGKPAEFEDSRTTDKRKTASVSHYVAGVILDSMIWSMDRRLFSLAEELYQRYGSLYLKPALAAALLTKPKEEAYKEFSGLLGKEREQQELERLELADTFARVVWNNKEQVYEFFGRCYDGFRGRMDYVQRELYGSLDVRWFELLTNEKLKKSGAFHTYEYGQRLAYYGIYAYYGARTDWDGVLEGLICPSDPEICRILGDYFYKRAFIAMASGNDRRYYATLKLCGFMEGKGLVVRSIGKRKTQYWVMEDMIKEAPMPPKDKLLELKEIKELVEAKKISVTGWNEERYQELYGKIAIEAQEACAEME